MRRGGGGRAMALLLRRETFVLNAENRTSEIQKQYVTLHFELFPRCFRHSRPCSRSRDKTPFGLGRDDV